MNQQVKTLQPLRYKSKTAICTVTRSCPRPGGTDLDEGMDRVTANRSFRYTTKGLKGLHLLIHSFVQNLNFGEKFRLLIADHVWKLVPPDVTHMISPGSPLISRATLKRSGSLDATSTTVTVGFQVSECIHVVCICARYLVMCPTLLLRLKWN